MALRGHMRSVVCNAGDGDHVCARSTGGRLPISDFTSGGRPRCHDPLCLLPLLAALVGAILLVPVDSRAQSSCCDIQFHTVEFTGCPGHPEPCWVVERFTNWSAVSGSVCRYSNGECPDDCVGPVDCGPPPCSSCADEVCDGTDGTSDGGTNESRDEAACGDDDDCANWRTDPVHVGSGAFVTETEFDVQFAGSPLPMQFTRHYTSRELWRSAAWAGAGVRVPNTRLAAGWLHNFDERLFAADASSDIGAPVSGTGPLVVVHRAPNGRGRGFSCPAPHAPTGSFDCDPPDDGSLETLRWDASTQQWKVEDGEGVVTVFAPSGRLESKHDAAGAGWSVQYYASGEESGLIQHVQDEHGRQLRFVWDLDPGVPARLAELRDQASATLATFQYSAIGLLTRAISAAGDETYVYLVDGGNTRPYLTQIKRNGTVVTDVTYEYIYDPAWGTSRYTGRVGSIVAADGTFELRYASHPNNLCGDAPYAYDETRTSMIIDRSVAATSGSTTCSVDSNCASGHACAAGYCRPFTCQEYVSFPGSTADFSALGALSGNCACSGGSTRQWIRTAGGGTRITTSTARDGTVSQVEGSPSESTSPSHRSMSLPSASYSKVVGR